MAELDRDQAAVAQGVVTRRGAPCISPVIVVPGITASDLHDEYALPPEAVWTTVRRKRYDRIALHPEDQRYELHEPARVAPRGPFPLIYEELVEELRDGLAEEEGAVVPVFPFGYDWRIALDPTEERLADFIVEVTRRTLLLRHYRDNAAYAAAPTVSLIGHSMGGLIIAGYLERYGAARVDKVISVGTPFLGSHEAILKLTTGTSDLGDSAGANRERRAARLMPALYHLLPTFPGALRVDEGLSADILSSDAWQPNVVRTIDAQVREWEVAGEALFREMLGAARAHRTRVARLRLRDASEAARDDSAVDPATLATRDWLAIAGVDARTRVSLRVRRGPEGAPRFDLRSRERHNAWDQDDPAVRRATGDGTVPLAGALPPFLNERHIVCVTPEDFGYWELRDRTLSGMAGLHGALPKMNLIHRLALRFLAGKEDRYGNTWGRRVPGAPTWEPPLQLLEKG